MAASSPSLKVTKSFLYRGGSRLWSNRYYFNGTTPPDSTHWTTFSDAVVTAEKAAHWDFTTIVETQGYAAGSDVPVFSKTYSTAGTIASSGITRAPGDAATLLRWSTASRTSKNHPLYLFNYYHGVCTSGATTPDVVQASQVSFLGTYAALWITGISDGTVSHHRCGPNGDLATGQLVSAVVRHRDFPN